MNEFPHYCPKCGSSAYIGLEKVECTGTKCSNYKIIEVPSTSLYIPANPTVYVPSPFGWRVTAEFKKSLDVLNDEIDTTTYGLSSKNETFRVYRTPAIRFGIDGGMKIDIIDVAGGLIEYDVTENKIATVKNADLGALSRQPLTYGTKPMEAVAQILNGVDPVDVLPAGVTERDLLINLFDRVLYLESQLKDDQNG